MRWMLVAFMGLFGLGVTMAVLFAEAPNSPTERVESIALAPADTGTPDFAFVPPGDPRLDHPAERGKFAVPVHAAPAFVPAGDPRLDHPAERGKFPPP